jgi:hypothetical protein
MFTMHAFNSLDLRIQHFDFACYFVGIPQALTPFIFHLTIALTPHPTPYKTATKAACNGNEDIKTCQYIPRRLIASAFPGG